MLNTDQRHSNPDTASGSQQYVRSEVQARTCTLGPFHISREIACGGMGRVYLAHRVLPSGVGQAAAVKVIHPHLARETEFINMFLDEARIASSIHHPNVCRVLDFGLADGMYYLAMDYVMGESLAEVMTRLSRSPDAKWIVEPLMKYVAHQVCEALHAVHEAEDAEGKPLGIVHRDISPQNIMIGYDGGVRLLDFGVALASERLNITRTGVIKGRLSYMAPEQMRGMEVDPRTDVWSVGVVLWEGLTGRRLFRRESDAETIQAVLRDPIPPSTHASRTVPASLQQVVAHALQREPADRYATARDFGVEVLRSKSSRPQASMSDVSEWMRLLFKSAIAQKRIMLREAAQGAGAAGITAEAILATNDGDDAPTCISSSIPREVRRAAITRAHNAIAQASADLQPSQSGIVAPAEQQVSPHPSGSLKSLWRGVRRACVAAMVAMFVVAPHRSTAPISPEHLVTKAITISYRAGTEISRALASLTSPRVARASSDQDDSQTARNRSEEVPTQADMPALSPALLEPLREEPKVVPAAGYVDLQAPRRVPKLKPRRRHGR